jgi:hypothetical protein
MSRRRLVAGGALVAAVALALALLLLGGGADSERAEEVAGTGAALGARDALGWEPERRRELEERAATGTSHVIYALSPGGVLQSAERTARWRPQIEHAAAAHEVDPDRLEALVFLESAGRAEVIAGETPEAASGLAQIIPSAATELLGMRVDLDRSIALSRKLERAIADGSEGKARTLSRERARVDERFDPERALDGAARYLRIATDRFGTDDLATVSYHMGIGNLESVVRAYANDEEEAPIGETVAAGELSYAQLFFDSAPDRNPDAHEILSGFADDSSLYLWRILASQRIMERWRSEREQLEHTVELATAKASLEELYHPQEATELFDEPGDVEDALGDGELLPLPDGRELGWVADRRVGELAGELDQEPELYRALRPEALATLSYMAARVRELSGATRPLRVTSAVRDRSYQDLLALENAEATQEYSLHTTGFAFDVLREYESDAQAAAFQFVLDRLRAQAVIDYAVEPRAIHVTVSSLGAELVAP